MDPISEILTRAVSQIIPNREELEQVLRSGKKLRIYTGIDPTGDTIHVGHTVWMWKLRAFQELGHEVIVLIGDFTAMVGDPSGKSQARTVLEHDQVLKNAKNYQAQIGKIIRFTGKNAAQIKFNGDWLSKLTTIETARLMSYLTVAQVIERDMFQERLKAGKDLFLNEFLYPLMQGYDSVAMDVDMEAGGSDQLFNMLTGRDLMKKIKNKNKFVLGLKLLTDPDGKKIGKTEGNAISITGKPSDLYGQILSLPDETIPDIFECATPVPMDKVSEVKKRLTSGENPMVLKKELAWQIVSQYNDSQAADAAAAAFSSTVQDKEFPSDAPTVTVSTPNLIDALVESQLVESKSSARRLIFQGGVEINGQKVTSEDQQLKTNDQVKVGKRSFARVNLSST